MKKTKEQIKREKEEAKFREEEQKRIEKEEKKKKAKHNREYAVVAYSFFTLFICIVGYISYFIFYESEKVIDNPYNKRIDNYATTVVRGNITDANGNILAYTNVAEDGTESRIYPYADVFAQVVGYTTTGKSGIESAENRKLLTSSSDIKEKLEKTRSSEKQKGDTVVTTLDAKLQQLAYNALGDNKGAVVIIEPSTGKVKAMVSKPSFDPNTLSANWDNISNSSDSVLLNRATQGLYPPGSIFKTLTTLEYLRENSGNYLNYSYDCGGSITHNNYTLACYDNTAHGHVDLKQSFAKSCNSSYANIGLGLNIDSFANLCESMLFNKNIDFDLDVKKSSFVLNSSSNTTDIMMTSIGQGETEVTPFHMALLAATVANNGVLMKPHLVERIENYKSEVVSSQGNEVYETLMSTEEAQIIQEFMEEVVNSGTGFRFNGSSFTVAGKTGTAEYSSDKNVSHSWFIGYTPTDGAQLAIAVVVEGGGANAASAIPVCKEIFNGYYG
ncbi:peptidoglycan glycosyltransferase [Acetitomaculum ruminis DSM 5522]|uniref:Peptidoglycan glycosyltransferase n=1 Tax=Acetitomaculum ruminis DSM 5522 TaxID=1120918 RepID=A0A1I0VI57_9FIRM|nr:peptidoglycan glycosyltransferase [Acetitomaculum ruminis DSM 5522]